MTSIRSPRLALPFTILPGRASVTLVAGEDVRYTLEGPQLDRWAPAPAKIGTDRFGHGEKQRPHIRCDDDADAIGGDWAPSRQL